MPPKKYQQISQREHAIKKPHMYMGSLTNDLVKKFVLEDNKFIIKEFEYNGGLYKIIDEAISNASDQIIEDKGCNIIKVNIDKEPFKITVWNNSTNGIELAKTILTAGENKGKEVYFVEMIFGEFLTSSNYDDNKDREANGTNGIGIKLTNVYSKEFTIETITNGKKAIKKYRNSLTEQDDIIISDVNDKINSVKISFIPDLTMFKEKGMKNHFIINDDFIKLLEKKIYDLSYCCNSIKPVKVYLNNKLIHIRDENTYINMYGINNMNFCHIGKKYTIGIAYTPEQSKIISFINNNPVLGGNHVDFIHKKIFKMIKDKYKNKDKTKKFKKEYLTSNLTLFCNGYIKNPTYDSQCKERLMNSFREGDDLNGVIGIDFNDDFKKMFDKFYKSGIMNFMNSLLIAAESANLKKTDGFKSSKIMKISNYERANKAGTKDSLKCKLIITEGLSAMTFAEKGRAIIDADYYGVFPIRGKLLNVQKANIKQITANQEISNIKQIIGLKQNTDYSKPENLNQLNYGGILILTDQDLDGYHIKCLIINFINYYWPELIKNGFCCSLQTPILKAFNKRKKNDILNFYSQVDFYNWCQINNVNDYKIQYYKGLGSSSDDEVEECFKLFKQNLITYIWKDENIDIIDNNKSSKSSISPLTKNICDYALELAFGDMADERKLWVSNYDRNVKPFISDNNEVSIDELINKELIHFSNEDCLRSIPLLYDGLKPSQRKILYTCIKKHIDNEHIKVSVLGSKTAAYTNYDHGDTSLIDTIINMAQDFPGSNNLNLLIPDGNFGTIKLGGDDHAAGRYIHTKLNKLVYSIFRKEDECILEHLQEEGELVEYKTFYPIIPMVLINGANGIGTGYKTNIPNFNIHDVIYNLKCIINEPNKNGINKMKDLSPYYNCIGHSKFIHPNLIEKINFNKWISFADYDVINNKSQNTIIIKALPIGKWTNKYTDPKDGILSKLMDDGIILNYKNNSNPMNVNIEVKVNGLSKYLHNNDTFGFTDINKLFSFTSIIDSSNMYLHKFKDGKDIISRYKNPNDIIIEFYNVRYDKYVERKDIFLQILKFDMDFINYKIKFIDDILNNHIKWIKNDSNFVIQQLIKLKYPMFGSNYKDVNKSYDYLLNINFKYFTLDYKNKLENDFINKKNIYEEYLNSSIEDIWLKEINEIEKLINDFDKKK